MIYICSMQLELTLNTWGGQRTGAGRPPRRYRSSELHAARERFSRTTPFHVTLRAVENLPCLRTPATYQALHAALATAAGRSDFAIVHATLQADHIHLTAEADSHTALSKGMQSFQVSAARRINRVLGRTGALFGDRYHPVTITSPTQARRTITYVLNNWRRHGRDRSLDWPVDWYSSGPTFTGWKELADGTTTLALPATYRPLPVSRARTWLLAVGWQRAGSISLLTVPGPADK
jgi:REP element-mobilizing transposase RayT